MKNILVVINSSNLKETKVLLKKAFRLLPENLKVFAFNTEFISDIENIVKEYNNCSSEIIAYSQEADKDQAKIVIEASKKYSADVVMVQHQKTQGQQKVLAFEKELLKGLTKSSLLICHNNTWGSAMKVLSTLDIENDSKEQSQLNSNVFEKTLQMTNIVNAELHFVSVVAISRISKELDLVEPWEVLSSKGAELKTKLDDYINAKNTQILCKSHVMAGIPYIEIPSAAKKLKADIVVLGNVARTGIKGLIIGDTAEKILTKLSADTFIVKK